MTAFESERQVSMRELFWYFLKLGWLAFGGPVGQIGLMHLQVVEREKWIAEEEFVRALNFVHILPGPEALQLVIYIGWKKRGCLGGVLAGLLFILPGFITLTALAWIYVNFGKRPEVLSVLWDFAPLGWRFCSRRWSGFREPRSRAPFRSRWRPWPSWPSSA